MCEKKSCTGEKKKSSRTRVGWAAGTPVLKEGQRRVAWDRSERYKETALCSLGTVCEFRVGWSIKKLSPACKSHLLSTYYTSSTVLRRYSVSPLICYPCAIDDQSSLVKCITYPRSSGELQELGSEPRSTGLQRPWS